ncbi:MAG TPA: right-handed parallel beta-helix repeat-containing protein [Vicinamibacterales bacterium]|nr:right-handed parallel beta-helix repeat-containing protein [Vicinamibacterales bacterium]
MCSAMSGVRVQTTTLALLASLTLVTSVVSQPVQAELPRERVDTDTIRTVGRTIHVPPGADLQAAINSARLGDEITLQPGATYRGPIVLPKKDGTGWLVLRTSETDAALLAGGGIRVHPGRARLMPKLVASTGSVITLAPGAHNYRLIGLELAPNAGAFLYNLVAPSVEPRSEADQPHHLIVDRCYLHGDATRGTRRAIALNGRYIAVIHSYLSDFKEAGADSQALAGWNGSGPFKILDNYLEGGAENVMFGGADSAIAGLVPSDIEILGNTFSKNPRWYSGNTGYDGSRWTMKNLLELKNARRVLLEANVFENFHGFAIVITPRNQSGGAPWSTVEDVTIRHNWMRQVSSLLNVSGFDEYHQSQPTRRITVEHNVAENIYDKGEPNPKMILINQGPDDVTIRHNTVLTPPGLGSTYLAFANANTKKGNSFVFADNIFGVGTYGLFAENPGLGTGPATFLAGHFRAWTFAGNVLINPQGAPTHIYPSGQRWVSAVDDVGFRDPMKKDFALAAKSRYRGVATDRGDPGANVEVVRETFKRFMSIPGP